MSVQFPNESAEYRAARNALLEAEVALRKQVELVAAQRRTLPLGGEVPVDFVFTDTDGNQRTLVSLFGDHETLALYSFMFGPEDARPCPACTSLMDGWNGQSAQVSQRIGFAAVSSAPVHKLATLKTQRGWTNIPLLSADGTDYQALYQGVDPGGRQRTFMNVFRKTNGRVHHFWGTELERAQLEGHPRHLDLAWPIWGLLDLTPEGRGDFFPDVFGGAENA